MRNLGASYFGKSDDDAAGDWFRIAALASQVGDNAEKADTVTAYESLANGKGIPDGMSDTVRINAKKMLADNLQGETVAAEQQIMADIASKAKEQGVGIHDYLKGNVESYLTTPASYRAVGNISKMFQERQLADASYQKAKMEEGVNRFKEVSSLVQAADELYKKGDLDGSRKMVEQISRIVPIPGFAKTNDETGELEGYTTDFDNGGHKPTGMKFDVGGFLNAAKQVTRDEFAYGYALNSQVVNEMNAKNLAEASIMKDKNGGRYMGFNFVNPYDATDTKFIVKQEGTGKTVGQFASIQDATDSGYTPYNQKYEEGERKIKYMDEDQSMQRSEHGARMKGMSADLMLKQLGIQDKKTDMSFQDEARGHQRKKWDYEESLYPTKEELEKAKLKKATGLDDKQFYKNLFGEGDGESGSTEPMSYDDMKLYKDAADKYRGLVDDRLLVPLIKEASPRAKSAVEAGTASDYNAAFNDIMATKLKVSPVELSLITSPEARNMKPEELQAKISNIKRVAAEGLANGTRTMETDTALGNAFAVDQGKVSNFLDTVLPGIIYDKQGKVDEIIADIGMKLNIDKDQAVELYQKYAEQHQPKSISQMVAEVKAKRDAALNAEYEEKLKRNRYLGKPTYGSLGSGNPSAGYLYHKNRGAEL